MNPLNFRKTSLGTRAIKIVAYNEWKAFKQNKGLLLSMGMSYGLLVLALSLRKKRCHHDASFYASFFCDASIVRFFG